MSIPENEEWVVEPGFERMVDVFRNNFCRRGGLGAACAVYRDGRKVLDLWGGRRDRHSDEPWEKDTLVLTYSLTKGMTALCIAHAVSRNLFDDGYETRVATIWPGFIDANVTIRELMSEKVGLSALRWQLNARRMTDETRIFQRLTNQRRFWTAGDRWGNHALTLGWLASRLLHSVSNTSVGEYFRAHIAPPDSNANGEFYIGLPQANADELLERMARIHGFFFPSLVWAPNTYPVDMVWRLFVPWTLTFKTLANPFVTNPACFDERRYHLVENGGAGGVGNARALAEIYGQCAIGGGRMGLNTTTINALEGPARIPRRGVKDKVLRTDLYYSLGFEKPFDDFNFGNSPSAFGTFAVGGGMAYADPEKRVGYAYVTNRLGRYLWADPRSLMLRQALDAILRH